MLTYKDLKPGKLYIGGRGNYVYMFMGEKDLKLMFLSLKSKSIITSNKFLFNETNTLNPLDFWIYKQQQKESKSI